MINNIFIHKLKVECEDNKEGAKQKKKFIQAILIILNINLLL